MRLWPTSRLDVAAADRQPYLETHNGLHSLHSLWTPQANLDLPTARHLVQCEATKDWPQAWFPLSKAGSPTEAVVASPLPSMDVLVFSQAANKLAAPNRLVACHGTTGGRLSQGYIRMWCQGGVQRPDEVKRWVKENEGRQMLARGICACQALRWQGPQL